MEKHQTIYIGTAVRQLRNECRMSQEDLAGMTGFTREYISKLECDHIDPTLGTAVAAIAKALGLKAWELGRPAEESNNNR
ncbi:helix-turn-helix domain-containing protein [Bacillus sp. FJAT-27245]|uniref:helix-turn-helix domain-containing protein n=1 Tax=Bacillus sp. FJAT-27245 TaxID=1684144 RepID=UPI0006A79ADD|nr:helix-turn-helix transcriptional regulator [Bacillus sp. FJAT-27245]